MPQAAQKRVKLRHQKREKNLYFSVCVVIFEIKRLVINIAGFSFDDLALAFVNNTACIFKQMSVGCLEIYYKNIYS